MKLIPVEYRKHGLLSRWVVLKMMGQIFIEKKLISDIKEDKTFPFWHLLPEEKARSLSLLERVLRNLTSLDNEINQFEVASSDMEFFEADVSVKGNHIFVSSQFVKNPKYVRYAWSDIPQATLFNSDNFPASSFLHKIE